MNAFLLFLFLIYDFDCVVAPYSICPFSLENGCDLRRFYFVFILFFLLLIILRLHDTYICRKKVDEDLREMERCLEEANRIEGVRIEVDTIKRKLQR